MADGGIGEAALYSAVIGAGTSAATGGDPMRGALLGGLTGGAMSGLPTWLGAGAAPEAIDAAAEASKVGGSSVMGGGINALTPTAGFNPALGTTGLDTAGNLGRGITALDVPNPAQSAVSNFNAPVSAAPTNLAYTPPTPTTSMGAGLATTPQPMSFGDNVSAFLKSGVDLSPTKMALAGGSAGLAEAMRAERARFGAPPGQEKYEGPLSKFRYDPSAYTPYSYKSYAGGGPVEQMSNANATGANTGFPMANMHTAAYATPYQTPVSQNVLSGTEETNVDPYTGQERLAGGGIASLGGYSDGGRLLRGPGDGVSDSIPATIGNRQPARLADGEFVVPARIVSELGNGSTDAGAKQLYAMMDRVQKARGKTTGKGKMAKDTSAAKYLPA
jgi:hypothetical protein